MNRLVMLLSRSAAVLAGGIVLLLLTGCSTFHEDWKRAETVPVPRHGIEGRWQGTWLSDDNGHTGKLRCIVTRKNETAYEFQYWATFWKLFRYTYSMDFQVHEKRGKYQFEGSENLGKLAGGNYSYQGEATPAEFFAIYRSRFDNGTFRMRRIVEPGRNE